MPAAVPQYRRSPNLVSYWAGDDFLFHNYATGARVAGTALTIGLLDYFDTWKPAAPLLKRSSLPASQLRKTLQKLVESSLLQQSNRPLPRVELEMEGWADWNPAAGFFHFSTKDPPFEAGEANALAFLSNRAATHPLPPITKTYRHGRRVELPWVRPRDGFSHVLLRRRTWRRFGRRAVSVRALSVLMRLTFGGQKLMDLGAAGRAMLRTSPSAGARNPLEAYVVVRHVSGIPPGIYYYAPLEHNLIRLTRGAGGTIERHLPGQAWYGSASFLVLMTVVFARSRWKYPSPRAYRDVLLEAGHFCQTFCLLATELGLAPFCSGALADSTIERDLGLDGVTESVIYACGAGTRPSGAEWAPLPETARLPAIVAPRSRLRTNRRV